MREQLESTLRRFAPLLAVTPPIKGWIRAIRDALGMTGAQLAKRVGVHRSRIARIEQDETKGNATLKTLARVAEALDCVFVYGFVPRTSLEQTVRNRAECVARKRLERVSQSMRLEDQELTVEDKQKVLVVQIDELVAAMPKVLWDEP